MIDIKKVKIALSRVSTALGGGVYREYNSSREPFEEDIATINEAIEELKKLKQDVKEFMKLLKRYHANNVPLSKEAQNKYAELFSKLSKLGSE